MPYLQGERQEDAGSSDAGVAQQSCWLCAGRGDSERGQACLRLLIPGPICPSCIPCLCLTAGGGGDRSCTLVFALPPPGGMRQWLFGIGSVKTGAEEGLSSSAEVLLLLVPRGRCPRGGRGHSAQPPRPPPPLLGSSQGDGEQGQSCSLLVILESKGQPSWRAETPGEG